MTTMQDIQQQTEEYAAVRKDLEARIKRLQTFKDQLDKRYMPGITRALQMLIDTKEILKNLIDGARELFKSPKTQIFSGVKVGLKKGKGKMSWDNDDEVVARIEKQLPDQADQLIRKKKVPNKEALEALPADKLKKLGITVEEAGDQVYIKDMESEIEKIIKALMKSEEEDRAEAA